MEKAIQQVLSILMMYLKKMHLEMQNSVGLLETVPSGCDFSDIDIHILKQIGKNSKSSVNLPLLLKINLLVFLSNSISKQMYIYMYIYIRLSFCYILSIYISDFWSYPLGGARVTICLRLGPSWFNYWFSFTLANSRISHEYSSLFIIVINLIFVFSF